MSALLGLVGIEADPVRSREHILLSNILENAWRAGQDLDMAKLIMAVQKPPFRQVGVFDVETFFPEKDRFGLAMALNNIIASPSFGAWMKGEPLDIGAMLHTPDGKPRHSIFYIAHLSDAERMFFVTILLEQIISWMRAQPGTTSLRALLYMDEVFGYFPPTANPPSKRPMLTLLKQARAFGAGRRADHAEPGGPGLQGPDQRRHLVHRQAAGRARQGPPDGRPGERPGRGRLDDRHRRRWTRSSRRWTAASS